MNQFSQSQNNLVCEEKKRMYFKIDFDSYFRCDSNGLFKEEEKKTEAK